MSEPNVQLIQNVSVLYDVHVKIFQKKQIYETKTPISLFTVRIFCTVVYNSPHISFKSAAGRT